MPARIPLDPALPKILTALLTRNAPKPIWTPGGTTPMELQNLTGKLLFIV